MKTEFKTDHYILYQCGNEKFASDLIEVSGVLESCEIIPIKTDSKSIKGYVISEGQTIPVVDLNQKLHDMEVKTNNKAIIIFFVEVFGELVKAGVLANILTPVVNKNNIIKVPSHLDKKPLPIFSYGKLEHRDNTYKILDFHSLFSIRERLQFKMIYHS